MGLLGWASLVLVVAGVAAILGFGGMAPATARTAKWLFFVSITVFVTLVVAGLFGGGAPVG